MKIAIVGAGFIGLSAGLKLVQSGQEVTLFEATGTVGGLAGGFKQKGWRWTVDKFYHHIFTGDGRVIELARSLGIEPIFSRPVTAIYWSLPGSAGKSRVYPFDSAIDFFRFPGLRLIDKLRMGLVLSGFKLLPRGDFLERWTAKEGLSLLMGERGYQVIWEPLIAGKFHQFKDEVNLAWFWARIKKRTARLGTFPGGCQALADRLADEVKGGGGEIKLNSRVNPEDLMNDFEVVLSTVASATGRHSDVPSYLDAHVLLLQLKKPLFSNGTYWVNILDRRFPFLVAVDHTNFVDPVNFGGSHLAYFGNYLPQGDRLFSFSSSEVLDQFLPGIKRISPGFSKSWVRKAVVFQGRFAQPVMTLNYSKKIEAMRQSDKLYLANQAMINPWDRGLKYVVE